MGRLNGRVHCFGLLDLLLDLRPHKRGKFFLGTCRLDKWVHKQLLGCGALVGDWLQAAAEEVHDGGTPQAGLELCGRIDGDHEQSSQRRLLEKRRLAFRHLDERDAQRPNIHLRVVLVPLDELGRHPVGRADDRRALRLLTREVDGEPEISQFDFSVEVDQDVVALDVSVQPVLPVQEGEAHKHALAHIGHVALHHGELGADNIREATTHHELQSNAHGLVGRVLECIHALDDIRVLAHALQGDFIGQLL